jgi:hypothetical protein
MLLGTVFFKAFHKKLKDSQYEPLMLYSKNSLLAKIKGFRWIAKPFRLMLVCFFIFAIVGLFSLETNTFFSSTPSMVQQFTEAGQVLSSAEPASTSENLLLFFIMNLALLGVWLIGKNKKWSTETITITSFLTVVLVTIISWAMFHTLRYGSQETAMIYVIFFAFIGSIITLITRSFIPWHIFHFMNNLYLSLGKMFPKDNIVIWTIVCLIPILGLIIWKVILTEIKTKDLVEA